MKKGQEYTGIVERVDFPNKGIVNIEDKKVLVKGTIKGQTVRFVINKNRGDRSEGRLLEIIKKSELETTIPSCKHFGSCGGCVYQTLPYNNQLRMKEEQVKRLLDNVVNGDYSFEGIAESPREWAYRNKMEFTFGDEYKNGPLVLGLHKKGSMYDIVSVTDCRIVHEAYNKIISCINEICNQYKLSFYHKITHIGYLRHLLVRRAEKTGEIIVALVTSSQAMIIENESDNGVFDEKDFLNCLVNRLKAINLDGELAGILHIVNDSVADVVKSERMDILYGRNYIYDEILGLRFKISVFSFFQTNTLGAEILYSIVREFAEDTELSEDIKNEEKVKDINDDEDVKNIKGMKIYDLYSGTGTIAQVLAPSAEKIIGVEIVEEAVKAARINAKLNGLTNCEFIAGDVLKVIDEIEDKPDMIVLDPPREGIHPKALLKIIGYGVSKIVYISCNPISLVRDIKVLQEEGYRVERVRGVDMFPMAGHVEVVTCLHRVKNES